MRILLAEANILLADKLNALLKRANYTVDWRVDCRDIEMLVSKKIFDLIIMNSKLPGNSVLKLLQKWRKLDLKTPILMLLSKAEWPNRILALRAGADDYVGFPFEAEELLFKIRAILNRNFNFYPKKKLIVGNICINEDTQEVSFVDTKNVIKLTKIQFNILRYLILNHEKLITKKEIFLHLYENRIYFNLNIIDVHICNLRQKIGSSYIVTQRFQGYRFYGHNRKNQSIYLN